jgi:hypothetical protein
MTLKMKQFNACSMVCMGYQKLAVLRHPAVTECNWCRCTAGSYADTSKSIDLKATRNKEDWRTGSQAPRPDLIKRFNI